MLLSIKISSKAIGITGILARSIPLVLLVLLLFSCRTARHGDWCQSKCNTAGDEKQNTEHVHDMQGNTHPDGDRGILVFPLRVGIVTNRANPVFVERALLDNTLAILNEGFKPAGVRFELARLDTIYSPYIITDLSKNGYLTYSEFSAAHDLPGMISLFLFDYNKELCRQEGSSISCSRSGGFSFVLSRSTNNLVLSKFELGDHKVIVHEFGHFFGLYHTFEDYQFGKEKPDGSNCGETGDRICDTPADPGSAYEVHVNYSLCEMIGNVDPATGLEYKPLLNNYMAYYRPCYLKKYEFTPMQLAFIRTAARSDIRVRFAK